MDEKVIFIMAAVLVVILVAAGIYFLVYQRHINKALNDPEGAKKSRIKLPSLGTSYTGMWFAAWIVSVIITLVMIVDISSAAKLTVMYGEINSEKLNWLQDELARTDEKIDKVYNEVRDARYVSENNTKFELGNFNPETNTIEFKAFHLV